MMVVGVIVLVDSLVNICVVIKVVLGMQWVVGCVYNCLVKIYFDKVGIEILFLYIMLYFGEDCDGNVLLVNVCMFGDECVVDIQLGNGLFVDCFE